MFRGEGSGTRVGDHGNEMRLKVAASASEPFLTRKQESLHVSAAISTTSRLT